MNLLKKIKASIIIIISCIFLCSCYDEEPIENLSIVTGFGYDIEKNDMKFVDPAEFLVIKTKEEAGSMVLVGEGSTMYSIVENRVTKQSKTIIFGTEIVYIISEERAKFGIKDVVDDLLRSPELNINAMIVICKGKCEDYFSLKPETGTMSEQLFEMLKFSYEGNFYSKNNSVNDFLLMYHQQGRQVYLPYIEIINGKPQLTGAAVFNKDKMIKKISLKDTKLINLLRSSGGEGYIYISLDNPLKYLDIQGENKIKVKVSTEDNHLKYDIFVNISADLKIDTLYEKELTRKQISKIEKLFEDKLQKDLNKEVKKIQEEYGVDCLDLGKYAIAKYGRDSGYDSYKYFSSAYINVHLKVNIKSIGRIYRSHIED
ncbi:Ger(x)C family spore germination protein [Anaeromicrobium sediminis]|uniref:Uncharacterized protein n=1 Tax=Anaeromicrobium sediminis TaxID=1478221 RepID=A0A267MI64_9FIRM|nr:Ger(x)C family spore germination protein [Anaeromicrobium sediminis]PAB59137.1 hypothetical protein CCE28_11505 [Anaeromicrobium sediminis]